MRARLLFSLNLPRYTAYIFRVYLRRRSGGGRGYGGGWGCAGYKKRHTPTESRRALSRRHADPKRRATQDKVTRPANRPRPYSNHPRTHIHINVYT